MIAILTRSRPLLMLFGGTFGSAFFSLAAQLLLARFLIVSDYGRLATVLAAVNLLSPVSSFGVNWFWVQVFGREGYGAFRWIRSSFVLLGITNLLSLVGLASYILYVHGVAEADDWLMILFAGLMLLGQCAVEIASVKFQLEERFGQLALWQTLMQIGRFIVAGVLILTATRSLSAVLAGYSVVGLLLLVSGASIARDFQKRRLRLAGHVRQDGAPVTVGRPSLFATAKLSFPFAATTIFYMIYFQSTILLVAWAIGPDDTAIFSAALLILSAVYLVPNIIFTKFLFVRICRWAEHDTESFSAILHVSVASMIVVGIAVMVVVAVGAPIAVPLIFSTKYVRAVPILIWMTPTIPLRFVQSAYSAMFVSEENVRRRVTYGGVSAACSLAINLALLPTFGLIGAVVASVASEAIMLLLSAWGTARHVKGIRFGDTFRVSALGAATTRILRSKAAHTQI